jgi:hypothetical protein
MVGVRSAMPNTPSMNTKRRTPFLPIADDRRGVHERRHRLNRVKRRPHASTGTG